MPTPDSIEAALSRLMAPALSESGQRSIEAMLDELAAAADPASAAVRRIRPRGFRWAIPSGIAAALAVMSGLVFNQDPSAVPVLAGPAGAVATVDEMADNVDDSSLVLISESSRVEDISDEGWLASPEGGAAQAVRCRVLEASTFRDEETGIEVVVAEPREEVLLMPVSVF